MSSNRNTNYREFRELNNKIYLSDSVYSENDSEKKKKLGLFLSRRMK